MMCAMFIILVAFASVKMAFDSVPLALFSRASGLIGTEYTSVRYIRTPELLDELSIAKANGELKSTIKAYAKLDLLILDEWLIRRLSYNEAYDLLEIVEARRERSMIFCTQYETEGWYGRIHPDEDNDSPISEAIMDRIIHNSYSVMIDGKCSMRERHGLNAEVTP